jgi:hypothetical protein
VDFFPSAERRKLVYLYMFLIFKSMLFILVLKFFNEIFYNIMK